MSGSVYCVQSSEDGFRNCSSLPAILAHFNDFVGGDECLRLELAEGEYVISPAAPVEVNYTLVMVAPRSSGGVRVTCSGDTLEEGESSNCPRSAPLVFNKKVGRESDEVAVVFERLRFDGCTHPLQFDNLDRVAIDNCSFR